MGFSSIVVRLHLTTSFGESWDRAAVEPAVLDLITNLSEENYTNTITEVLKHLQEHKPELMKEHRKYLNLRHFQTYRKKGDVHLFLEVKTLSLYPKPIATFMNGPSICMIRQKVPDLQFLMLAGPSPTESNLENKIEVNISTFYTKQIAYIQ